MLCAPERDYKYERIFERDSYLCGPKYKLYYNLSGYMCPVLQCGKITLFN